MNTKDLPGIAIVKRIKVLNTVGKQISTLAGIWRKLLIGKAGQFLGRSKRLYILWRILITLTKFPECFLKWNLSKLITFASVKLYCLITLISHIAKLLLILTFCCFRQVLIFFLNICNMIIYAALWWEKHLSKRSLIKHTWSWRDTLIILWTLNRQAKMFSHISDFNI